MPYNLFSVISIWNSLRKSVTVIIIPEKKKNPKNLSIMSPIQFNWTNLTWSPSGPLTKEKIWLALLADDGSPHSIDQIYIPNAHLTKV